MKTWIEPPIGLWEEIVKRPVADKEQLQETVRSILQKVKVEGDAALKFFTEEWEGRKATSFKVPVSDLNEAASLISAPLKAAINIAKENIEKFHRAQTESIVVVETMPGVRCWRKSVPIEKVGLYVPGGTAPLFSSQLMLGIPATLAGCKEIVVCSPAAKNGKIHPAVLYVAQLLGISNVYAIGGAQAIAAMAFGTETIPKVFKIFGPGNQFVTAAKEQVSQQGVSIDMPAGPSELAVFADETCVPAFVAADLISQAEHGSDSQVILVATSAFILESVQNELIKQLKELPRAVIANQALDNSCFIQLSSIEKAFEFLNLYAPEHLIIASESADELVDRVVNAGSVFLGNLTPESAGDYASGTNHTLPTGGHARAMAGVSLDSFVRKITFQQLSQEGVDNLAAVVEEMALAEGLTAHANAKTLRKRNASFN